jgi:hypothetical protein
MPDLALPDQLLNGAGDILDRHVRIDAVLVEEIDVIGLETLQRGLGHLPDALRATVEARGRVAALKAEFGRDDHLIAERGQGFAHEFLVRKWTVRLGSVEEGDVALNGRPDQRNSLVLADRWTIGEAQAHAAEPDRRDFQSTFSECAFMHLSAPYTGITLAGTARR